MQSEEFPFIGREDALNAFHGLLSTRAQKNVLYVEARGGLGKTRLLHKIVETCQKRPHWHVCPPGSRVEPIIDFFELSNRSVAGLRRSIVDRLGWEYFEEFEASEDNLRAVTAQLGVESVSGGSTPTSAIFALRRRTDDLFFKNLRQALRGRQVVLFFDTFEVAHRRRVGRWFLEQFLPRSVGSLIVLVGRPPRAALPIKVQCFELKPWTETEATKYFKERGWTIPEEEVHILHERTGGHPLLMDMVIYLRNAGIAGVRELAGIPREKMEWALIDRLVRTHRPEHQAIQEMAYLKRRFAPRIFAHRQRGEFPAYVGISDYDDLVSRLLDSELRPIVKYRPEGQVLTLHDEVQRMIEQHAYRRDWDFAGPRPDWEDLCTELYEQVVQGWYGEAIRQAQSDDERALLQAEQLGYELDHDAGAGLALYRQCFEEAQGHRLFDFNELIWGEVADRLAAGDFPGQEYELCYAQAEWLWAVSQFDAAAELYRLIVERYTPDPRHAVRKLDALAALGRALTETGKYEEALKSFDAGLALAEQIDNKTWLSAFQQNKGRLLQTMHAWDEAEVWLKQAVETAEHTKSKEALALACLYLGWLQALVGRYHEAILNCGRAVALRREVLDDPEAERRALEEGQDPYYEPVMVQPFGYYSTEGLQVRVAFAYLRLGEAYRYFGPENRQKARRSYEKALEHLPTEAEYRVRCEVLQGLGNIYHDEGADARKRNDFAQAVGFHAQAFEALNQAITLCREHRLGLQLPKALHRLAHVFFGVGQLEQADDLKALIKDMSSFLLPEEGPWLEEVGRLREETQAFAELDTLAKAQRLFEVSSLEAELVEDYNISLDSLFQACEVALYRGQLDDVRTYARLTQVPSRAYQQDLFIALTELMLADLDLKENRLDQALARYGQNFPIVTRSGGYGRYLLKDHLARLGQRLEQMPPLQAVRWCDQLIDEWTQEGLGETHPELIARMWEYRNLIVEESD